MRSVPLLPNLAALTVEWIRVDTDAVRFGLVFQLAFHPCPTCGQRSSHVHSHYLRTLKDLSAHGRPIELQIRVRRFSCTFSDCPRQTFVEQIPSLMTRYSRKTNRLVAALRQIGQRVGGEAGSRLAERLSMPVSADTLLRIIRRTWPPPVACGSGDCGSGPRVLGVDDWAFHRGQRYGTILCDLELHQPIDLLPDRSAETLAVWLKDHPHIEIISRDRATDYAKGAAMGAPQAKQVADRWHLLHNLIKAFQRALDRQHALLAEVARSSAQPPSGNVVAPLIPLPNVVPPSPTDAKLTRRQELQRERSSRREQRYAKVKELQTQGLSLRQIAGQLQLSRCTVRRYAGMEQFPQLATRPPAASPLDAYMDYLKRRWLEGCHTAAQLYREVKQRGFSGSRYMVRRRVATWRVTETTGLVPGKPPLCPEGLPVAAPRVIWRPSARNVVWLLLKPENARTAGQKAFLLALRNRWPELAENVALIQEFRSVLGQRRVDDLEAWVELTGENAIVPEIRRFAQNLRQDWAAVSEAIRQPWSNGQVEGQVNRLKLIKRQMYGRANFDLLRQRVLHTG